RWPAWWSRGCRAPTATWCCARGYRTSRDDSSGSWPIWRRGTSTCSTCGTTAPGGAYPSGTSRSSCWWRLATPVTPPRSSIHWKGPATAWRGPSVRSSGAIVEVEEQLELLIEQLLSARVAEAQPVLVDDLRLHRAPLGPAVPADALVDLLTERAAERRLVE